MKLRTLKNMIAISFILGSSAHYGHTSEQWTGEFRLLDGSSVRHTPSTINMGYMTANSITMRTASYNGITVKAPIILHVKHTRSQFVTSLIDAGLYQPTATELRQYNQNAEWTAEYPIGQHIIIHKPEGVCCIDLMAELMNPGIQRNFSQTLMVNKVLLRRNFTQDEFEVEIGKIKIAAGEEAEPVEPENLARSMSSSFSELEAEMRAFMNQNLEDQRAETQATAPSASNNNTSTVLQPSASSASSTAHSSTPDDDFWQRAFGTFPENPMALGGGTMRFGYFPDNPSPRLPPFSALMQEYEASFSNQEGAVDANSTSSSLNTEATPAEEDISHKNDEANWSKTYFVGNMILKHEPTGISYVLRESAHLEPAVVQSLTLKGITFETNSAKQDFEKAIKAYLALKP